MVTDDAFGTSMIAATDLSNRARYLSGRATSSGAADRSQPEVGVAGSFSSLCACELQASRAGEKRSAKVGGLTPASSGRPPPVPLAMRIT